MALFFLMNGKFNENNVAIVIFSYFSDFITQHTH